MQTNQRIEALKRSGRKISSPMVVLALIDTGASLSAHGPDDYSSLGLAPRDVVSVHTPTTGPAYEKRWSYDALFIAGETSGDPLSIALQVIEAELASQGPKRNAHRGRQPGGTKGVATICSLTISVRSYSSEEQERHRSFAFHSLENTTFCRGFQTPIFPAFSEFPWASEFPGLSLRPTSLWVSEFRSANNRPAGRPWPRSARDARPACAR